MTTKRDDRPAALQAVDHLEWLADGVAAAMAWLSGCAFLLLSIYITVDVLGRRYGGPYSGATDDISGYVLAVAGTWGFAYALKKGVHVRVDLLLPFLPRRINFAMNLLNLALTAVFAGMLAWFSWLTTLESFELDSRSISALAMPLVYPQGLMSFGLTMLAVQAIAMLAADSLRATLLGSSAWAGKTTEFAPSDQIHGV